MTVGRVALLVLLAAAVSLLILDLTSRNQETGTSTTHAVSPRAGPEVEPGEILWANWHKPAPKPGPHEPEIGVVKDLAAEDAEAAKGTEVSDARRAEIEERFRGLDVALPIGR